jgi:GTPase SAR1 family protein
MPMASLSQKSPSRLSREALTACKRTFWDFAGQEAYQVAHSLFFSRRTLYLICVDLEAFTTTFLQASIMSFVKKQETQLMDEFIERTVMCWIRLILAHQLDVEFVFIATKEDLLAENQVTGKLNRKPQTVMARLACPASLGKPLYSGVC